MMAGCMTKVAETEGRKKTIMSGTAEHDCSWGSGNGGECGGVQESVTKSPCYESLSMEKMM
jgi:hypothetical protein